MAALADALKKASKVAPSRGVDFTKFAGVVIDITEGEVVVMARDSEVTFATWLTPDSTEGPNATWRLSARTLPEVVAKLKTERDKVLTLAQNGTNLNLAHGRGTRAQFRMMDSTDYPKWMPFSPDDMQEVDGIAGVANALAWAISKGTDIPHTGIHFDGEIAIATDRYRFATTPCAIDLPKPITIPVGPLVNVLRPNEKVRVRVDGSQMYVMPDEMTQMAFTAYGVDYPPIRRVMKRDYPRMVKVNKAALVDIIELAMPMSGSDRSPTVLLIFGREEIAAMLENDDEGKLGSTLETPGQLNFSPREEVRFKPENILAALGASPGTEVMLGYDPAKPKGAFYINAGADELEFWVAPRQKQAPSSPD